ncbi:MAG: GNAT family N-acetyltransferase [Clostridia bacterium]|nr:GNAT family N-acetyltransferase [Clostridia bacterium]
MTYKTNSPISASDVADLRQAVGWNRIEESLQSALSASFCHIAAYDKNKLIGFVDCVSNGVTDAYIQDLMVHPDYQGKGIGSQLMDRTTEYLKEKHIYMISVVYDKSLKGFYERFGFFGMLSGQMQIYNCE